MTLNDYLTQNGISALEFGRKIGLKQPNSIYRWLRGERTPRPAHLRRIKEETQGAVTANDFFDAAS